ncbi:MAG: LacI family DNA-binding transcriptional regulator [Propioniciclava sp.]
MSLGAEGGRNPTRQDVARRAHTSLATVSYVVNNGPKRVSAQTRDRVLRAIAELGYRPDPVARSFRGVDDGAIGMLVPNFNGPFFADLVAEVERQAVSRGKVVLFGSTGYDPAAESSLMQTFRDRRVGAVLIIGPTPHVKAPGIEHGALNVLRMTGGHRAVAIGIAQREATRAVVQHLFDHGRRRVAALFGPTSHGVFNVRYRGWKDVAAYTPQQTRDLVRRSDYSFHGGYTATLELFDQAHAPDGLFVSNDTQAVGALKALNHLGFRVPDDVAVVSIDSTELSPFLVPSLTSISQPTGLLAEAALDVVEGIVAQDQTTVRVPFTLEVRDSCGCGERTPAGETSAGH